MKNNLSEVANPDMKLSELALGYIPIAKLAEYSIDNETPISVPYDWSNKEAKNWNVTVWSKFNKITNVQIINE